MQMIMSCIYYIYGLPSDYDPFMMILNARPFRNNCYLVSEVSALSISLYKKVEKRHPTNMNHTLMEEVKKVVI